MIIRLEQPRDAQAIDAVHRSAFADPALPGDPGEVGLVQVFRRQAQVGEPVVIVSMVAENEAGEVVGHVCLTRGTLAGTPAVGIGPLGVVAGAQGAGVGSALMHAALGAVDALGEKVAVLLGDEGYYHRFGFVEASTLGIVPDVDEWAGPHFQARALTAAGDQSPSGTFRYAEAFYDI